MKVRFRYRPCQLKEHAKRVAIALNNSLFHLFFRKFLNESNSVGDAKTIRELKEGRHSERAWLLTFTNSDKTLADPVTA